MNKLDMSDKRLYKLKLSKQSVMELLYTCRQTPSTKVTSSVDFFDETSSRKAPIMKLDFSKVTDNLSQIAYLLGQLQAIHDKRPTMTPAAGIIDYTGKKWTDDNKVLFALYYLSTAAGCLPRFIDGEKYAYSNLTQMPLFVLPTYPPDDPRFDVKRAKRALKGIGIQLTED